MTYRITLSLPQLGAGRLLSGLLACLGLFSHPAAMAAEWDGYSFTTLVGMTQQSSKTSAAARPPTATSYFSGANDPGQIAAEGSGSFSGADWSGGVKVGYSWQSGHVVKGIDISTDTGFDQSMTNSAVWISSAPARFSITQRIKADPMLAIRPRIGWAWDNKLVYVTAGVAAVRVSLDTTFRDNFIGGGITGAFGYNSKSETRIGSVIGFGTEYALTKVWSLSAQYLYADFGSISNSTNVTHRGVAGAGGRAVIDSSADLRSQSLMFGLTYRFKE